MKTTKIKVDNNVIFSIKKYKSKRKEELQKILSKISHQDIDWSFKIRVIKDENGEHVNYTTFFIDFPQFVCEGNDFRETFYRLVELFTKANQND